MPGSKFISIVAAIVPSDKAPDPAGTTADNALLSCLLVMTEHMFAPVADGTQQRAGRHVDRLLGDDAVALGAEPVEHSPHNNAPGRDGARPGTPYLARRRERVRERTRKLAWRRRAPLTPSAV